MVINIINIINRLSRTDRREAVTRQMQMEKCQFKFWDGVEGKNPIQNINSAFKRIIAFYKTMPDEYCFVAEDDLNWCGSGAWKYFQQNIPKEFDIFTASYYSGSHDENFVVKNFAGMTLVCVHKKYYDTFLSLPPDKHIDRAIAASGAKIVTCYPFVATQVPGFSDQRKRMADDSHRLKDKILYNGE